MTDALQAPVRVAFVRTADPSPEERAALEWCRDVAARVDCRTPQEAASSGFSTDAVDVVWWHASRLPEEAAARAGDPIRAFVADGGGLLLTGGALAAVTPLGVDPVPPDVGGADAVSEATGLSVKALFVDHPAFEGFDADDGRLHTCEPDERAVAAYDAVLPERGDVLASTICGDEDRPERKVAVQWAVGDGHVVGVGDGLTFRDGSDFAAARNRDRLARNLLAVLGGDWYPAFTDRPDDAAGMAALRRRVDERDAREGTHGDASNHRPAYHVSPPAGWLNDPNGLIEHEGTYHLFYQYNPGGPTHETIHWGHATSDDLVHWHDEPVALAPDPDGPDRDGCWSGCAVVDDDGTPTLLYTGGAGRTQLACRATTTDPRLRTWTKDPDNPIIDEPPSEPSLLGTDSWEAEFRDHCVWRDSGTWYQLIGSGVEGAGGTALLYRSPDLRDWEYVGPLLVGDWEGAGHMWECPELLDFGDQQLLHVSNYDEVQYYLGRATVAGPDAPSFERRRAGVLDHGDFYAPQSMALDDRYLTWGWLVEPRSVRAQWEAGWSGMLSVPRELDVEDGHLRQRPAPELAALRERETDDLTAALVAGERRSLAASGTACELALEVDLGSPTADAATEDRGGSAGDPETPRTPDEREATGETGNDTAGGTPTDADDASESAFVLSVLESPARSEVTEIRYTGGEVIVDRSQSSLDPRGETSPQRLPVDGEGPLSLRVFVDGSAVELFADGRECLSSRVYPSRKDATGVALAARGGPATVDCTAWELGSAFR